MISDETDNHSSPSTPDLESASGNEPLGAQGVPSFAAPVCIHVKSFRRRLADVDALSFKAALDGLVERKILGGDTTKEIREITYSQEKTMGVERTVITIEEME